MAPQTYSAQVNLKVSGLEKLEALNNAVQAATSNISLIEKKFNSINPALKAVTAGTVQYGKTVKRVMDPRVFRENTEYLQRQVQIIKARNVALGDSLDVTRKLSRAQTELNRGTEANLQLIRAQLRNARELLKVKEQAATAMPAAQKLLAPGKVSFMQGVGKFAKGLIEGLAMPLGMLAGVIKNSNAQDALRKQQQQAAKLRFENELGLTVLQKIGAQLKRNAEIAVQNAEAAKSWRNLLEQAQDIRAERRAFEGQQSNLARQRLAAANPFPVSAGIQLNPAGRAAEQMAQMNQLAIQRLNTESKTLQVQYSWIKAGQDALRIRKEMTAEASKEAMLERRANLTRIRRAQVNRGRQQQQLRRQQMEGLGLGIGFPLLFGAGPASVIGSGLGTFMGSNPMSGQILAGAVGQMIDNFIAETARLGAALNPLTADLQKVTEAAGLTGTAMGKTVKELETAGEQQEAMRLATIALSRTVGWEGVEALSQFGEASTKLGNQLTKTATLLGAALAKILGPGLTQTVDSLERDLLIASAKSSDNPEIKKLLREREKAAAYNPFDFNGAARYDQLGNQIAELQRQGDSAVSAEAAKVLKDRQKAIEDSLRTQIALASTNGDLLKDQNYETAQKAVQEAKSVKLLEAAGNQHKINRAELEAEVELTRLKVQREEQLRRQREESIRKMRAATQAQLQADNAFLQARKSLFEIGQRGVDFVWGEVAGYERQLSLLQKNDSLNRMILQTELDQARNSETYAANAEVIEQTFTDRLRALDLEYQLTQKLLKQSRDRAVLEKAITTAQSQRNLKREVDALTFTGGMDRLESLKFQQRQQREAVLGPRLDRIDELKKILAAPEGVFNQTQLTNAREELQQVNSEVGILSQRLTEVQGKALAWEQNRIQIEGLASAVNGFGNAVGQAMTSAVDAMVNGTKSAEQVFAEFLKSVGDMLMQTAAQMIAQYIAIGLAKAFAGMGGGGSGGGFKGDSLSQFNASAAQYKFAEGGFVTRPTNALIGEGGEPEYVIPSSKMNSAMERWNAGARGSSVIPDAGDGGGGGGEASGGNGHFSLETVVINSVEYATVDQVKAMGAAAAKQGAAGGEARTLRRLQMSPGTRKRVGI